MKKTISLDLLYFIAKHLGRNLSLFLSFFIISGFVNASEKPSENNIEKAEENTLENEPYIGFFAGTGKTSNKHTDPEGFANWGNPGSSVDYDDTGAVGGVLIGKKIDINGVPIRLELDGTFGEMSASTNQLDPKGLDETAEAKTLWLITARAGLEKELESTTLFINGGLALAEVHNSVIDLDYNPDGTQEVDPDDSFEDKSIRLGWVVGVGAEFPLTHFSKSVLKDKEVWTLRIEGFHADFGEHTYTVNRSGNNRCGAGGSKKACSYNIENEVSILRIVFSRPFSL